MKRIGLIALLHESNTFLDQPTTLAHFQANVLCDGADVLDVFRGSQHEMGGFINALQAQPGCQAVGVFAARATPYGAIASACWAELMERLLQGLDDAGPLDGLLVAPHGATVAESARDADGDWLTRVRATVGTQTPIIGTLDLHANVSPRMVQACQALLGYRTNPHLDQRERGSAAAELMARTLAGEAHPAQALVQLPMCVNIERQATAEPQGKRLWSGVERCMQDDPAILDMSCLYGFPYADVPEMGASVIAVANGSSWRAESAARQAAQHWWDMREEFVGDLVAADQAVAMAVRQRQLDAARPVGLLDMGDNVGGGSAGDGTVLTQAWMRCGRGPVLAVLYDPLAVQAAVACGEGKRLPLHVGGKTDGRHGEPIEDEFLVARLGDGKFTESQPRHGGYQKFDQGPTAILQAHSGLTVLATSQRVPPLSLQQLVSQGIDPSRFAALVIKGVHAPVAAYAPVCSQLIRVNTPGATCADLAQFYFQHRRKPMFPWEVASV